MLYPLGPLYRCVKCFEGLLLCCRCISDNHILNPFHRIQVGPYPPSIFYLLMQLRNGRVDFSRTVAFERLDTLSSLDTFTKTLARIQSGALEPSPSST